MYLLSVLSIILCFLLMSNIFPPVEFFDIISLLFLLLVLIPVMISSGMLKDLNNAFREVFGKRKKATLLELKRAHMAVKLAGRISLAGGVMLMLLQMIVMLHNMSEPATLGPTISVAVLIMIYAVIFYILLLPVGAKLQQRILEYIPPEEEQKAEEGGRPGGENGE